MRQPLLPPCTCSRPRDQVFKQITLSADALLAIHYSEDLPAETLYAGMAVLAAHFPTRIYKLAIFSPSPYSAWQDKIVISRVFTSVAYTEYWQKDILVVPIRDGDVWMMAFVYTSTGRVEVFDGCATEDAWRTHGKVSNANSLMRVADSG